MVVYVSFKTFSIPGDIIWTKIPAKNWTSFHFSFVYLLLFLSMHNTCTEYYLYKENGNLTSIMTISTFYTQPPKDNQCLCFRNTWNYKAVYVCASMYVLHINNIFQEHKQTFWKFQKLQYKIQWCTNYLWPYISQKSSDCSEYEQPLHYLPKTVKIIELLLFK